MAAFPVSNMPSSTSTTAAWFGNGGTVTIWYGSVTDNGATWREPIDAAIEELDAAAKRAAHLLALTLAALRRWRETLRRLRIAVPALAVQARKPARTCSLASSWQARGSP